MAGDWESPSFQSAWEALHPESASAALATLSSCLRFWSEGEEEEELRRSLRFLSGEEVTLRDEDSRGDAVGAGNHVAVEEKDDLCCSDKDGKDGGREESRSFSSCRNDSSPRRISGLKRHDHKRPIRRIRLSRLSIRDVMKQNRDINDDTCNDNDSYNNDDGDEMNVNKTEMLSNVCGEEGRLHHIQCDSYESHEEEQREYESNNNAEKTKIPSHDLSAKVFENKEYSLRQAPTFSPLHSHMVELAVSEINMEGVFAGYFREFLEFDRVWECISQLVGCLENSDEEFKRRCALEFEDMRETFFFINTSGLSVLREVESDTSSGHHHKHHHRAHHRHSHHGHHHHGHGHRSHHHSHHGHSTGKNHKGHHTHDVRSHSISSVGAKFVDMRLPLDLEAFHQRGFQSIGKHLNWVNCFHFEVVEASPGEESTSGSARRVFSFAWEKKLQSLTCQFIKLGNAFLWHDSKHMMACTKRFTEQGASLSDFFHFPDQDTIHFRVGLSLCLFWNVGTPTTTILMSATRNDPPGGRALEVKLIKIGGFSGWVTSLFVDNIAERFEILLTFDQEEDGSADQEAESFEIEELREVTCKFPHSTFSWHLRGTAPSNSVLLWVVHILWHKLVMSEFLFEALRLWASILACFAKHITMKK